MLNYVTTQSSVNNVYHIGDKARTLATNTINHSVSTGYYFASGSSETGAFAESTNIKGKSPKK